MMHGKANNMKTNRSLSLIALALSAATLLMWCMPAQCENWTYTYRDGIGKNEPLCRALVKRLNDYSGANSPDTRCSSWDIVSSYPKFTEPPWQELDPKEHKELLFKLMKGQYADYPPQASEIEKQKRDAAFRKDVDDFIKDGGHLRVWQTKPALIYGGSDEKTITSNKEQTFVQMGSEPEQTALCVDTFHLPADWMLWTRIVKPDVSEPDPKFSLVKSGTVNADSLLINTNALFVYEGKPILVGSQDIWRFSSGSLNRICEFK
jgi:hypothetical protein